VFFLLLAVDQGSKYLVVQKSVRTFENSNFAFSLRVPVFLMYLTYIVLVGLLVNWFVKKKEKNWSDKLGFTLILAGALSNIVERIIQGYVVDFIYLLDGVLNLADFFILAGILLLVFERKNKTL
jgi:signal peptidase II